MTLADTLEQSPRLRPEIVKDLPIDERVLTEVDHLLAARTAPDRFDKTVLEYILQNLITAVQEAAMPYAVSTTRHEVVHNPETNKRTFMWLGRTAVQTAMSGYVYHKHPNALKRVDIEVDEADYATESLRPGRAQVFISPRMTHADATLKEARSEHLGDDDAVRVSWVEGSQYSGQGEQRILQSLLVRDIPLQAWISMLRDPSNIFGKSIHVENETSALSVMKIHHELEVDLEKLPRGPVTILEEVVKYIDDKALQQKVKDQIGKYYEDQELMHQQAEFKARRWLEFECELAKSLASGEVTSAVKAFIISMQTVWCEDELELLRSHRMGEDVEFKMTRELAVMLEKAKRNTLWGGAAILSGNDEVKKQIDAATLEQVDQNEQLMFIAYQNGYDYRMLEAENARLVGGAGISVGRGCAGVNSRIGQGPDDPFSPLSTSQEQSAESDSWENNPNSRKWRKGVCQVKSCSTRPAVTEVGPCDVCKLCQAKFDRGEDPTKEKPQSPVPVNRSKRRLSEIFTSLDTKQVEQERIQGFTGHKIGKEALSHV